MFRIIALAIPAVVLAMLLVPYLYFKGPPSRPKVDLDEWWGPKNCKDNVTDEIKPFKVKFPESKIKFIKNRLRSVRTLTPPLKGIAFEYGFNTKELENWRKYWAEDYPFSEREHFFNKYPHFKTNIQGLDIHFIRVKPKVPNGVKVVPLLLLHGWPGSVREYYEAIPLLTSVSKNRDFAIEIILASLPGYGFSSAAASPGLGADKAAIIFRNLMHRLGFEKYYVQGDDFGALICKDMATLFPEEILGIHVKLPFMVTQLLTLYALMQYTFPSFTQMFGGTNGTYVLPKVYTSILDRSGYFHEQATKPDTVGTVVTDSPIGLAAYMLEKMATGTRGENLYRPDGGLTKYYTKDQLLDNVMVYCVTGSMTTAMRLYAETFSSRYFYLELDEIPTTVPTVSVQTRNELINTPTWALKRKFRNLLRDTLLENTGHYFAFEKPKEFSQSVVEAIEDFRAWHKNNICTYNFIFFCF